MQHGALTASVSRMGYRWSAITARSKTMGNELTIRVTTGDEEEDNEQIDKIASAAGR